MRDTFPSCPLRCSGRKFPSPQIAAWYLFWERMGARPKVNPLTHTIRFPGIERYDVPENGHTLDFTPHFELKQGFVHHTNWRPSESTLLAARSLATETDKVVYVVEDELTMPRRDRETNVVTFCRPDSVPVRGGRILVTKGKLNFGYPLVFNELYDVSLVDACVYVEQFGLDQVATESAMEGEASEGS